MACRAVRDRPSRALNRKTRGAPKDKRPCLPEEPITTYKTPHRRGWGRCPRTAPPPTRAEAERLCLPWEWVDGEVLAVIPAEAEVAERWQRLNEDLVGSLEGLERLRRDE